MKSSFNNEINILFLQFIKDYDSNSKYAIWKKQNQKFSSFWNSQILITNSNELIDQEIDEIVRILDKKGKGSKKSDEAVATVMIPQGVWRRMFNEIKKDKALSSLIDKILKEKNSNIQAKLIDNLYQLNEGKKNHLTGQSGNAINSLLAAYDASTNLSIVSLKDRIKLIEFLKLPNVKKYDRYSIGQKITLSNFDIINKFESITLTNNARTISAFCYSPFLKHKWKKIVTEEDSLQSENNQESSEDKSLFYLEEQLEDFLIKNWDRTELGKKYDLIEEDGELKSQQYKTKIGEIDILVKEKKTGVYVVIELKRGQSSDTTVGQLLRYMGWVEEHLSNGKPCKGIIIAGYFDEKLSYAIKKVPYIETFL